MRLHLLRFLKRKLRQSLFMFTISFCLYFLQTTIIPSLIHKHHPTAISINSLPFDLQNKHIQVLIAHPDDEVMFFSPSILELTKEKYANQVSLTCFSVGNDQGLGPIRKKELIKSLRILGIEKYQIIDDESKFKDSMSMTWETDDLLNYINQDTDVLLTFDDQGISGHPNHKSLYYGSLQSKPGIQVWSLKSWSLWEKYSFTIYSNLQFFRSYYYSFGQHHTTSDNNKSLLIFANLYDALTGLTAMVAGHTSQMVWFRWFWVMLSKYGCCNELVRVK